jgi:hypothetical protein
LNQLPVRVFLSDGDGGVIAITVYTEAELFALEAFMQAKGGDI